LKQGHLQQIALLDRPLKKWRVGVPILSVFQSISAWFGLIPFLLGEI